MAKRIYLLLAIGACAVLSAAAVWMGALNQDEGWYLYAANLVSGGKMPYRDFFYTQGPMLPLVYSAFADVWRTWGLLGARAFTLALGLAGIALAVALAHRLAPEGRKGTSALIAFFLLGSNIYHLYYLAIPKTYALAALFTALGFYLASFSRVRGAVGPFASLAAGVALAFACGTRISLGAMLAVVGFWLLVRRNFRALVPFALGGFAGLALVYGPFLVDPAARAGLLDAQAYHAARGGFDITWTVGSLSRLVRWYLPVFIVFGLGVKSALQPSTSNLQPLLFSFLAVFAVQMIAPFPYEDYQVPVMGLLAVYAAVKLASKTDGGVAPTKPLLMALGLSFATSFGSPLLESWSVNGQDRFWSLKKENTELAQLRDVASRIEALDPNGKTLLTQDLYLAIETGREVPEGLEMGPFSYWGMQRPAGFRTNAGFDDAAMTKLLSSAPCAIAALSGYSFAITVPACTETPMERQLGYWEILKKRYRLADREDNFGQNATTLLILKRK